MATKFIGLTIGPIGTTMSYSSKPAGLWFASALFSTLSRLLLTALLKQGLAPSAVASPYFELDDNGNVVLPASCQKYAERGVGMFHDRIVFEAGDFTLEKTGYARTAAIRALAELLRPDADSGKLGELTDFLTDYLRIYALEMEVPEGEAPLLCLGKYLSAAELEPHARAREGRNPLLAMMLDNEAIRANGMTAKLRSNWILNRPNGSGIRDLEHIAAADQPLKDIVMKPRRYYAVLESDGDSMSVLFGNCKTTAEIRDYSKKCLSFCAAATKLVLDYGGMPIYAGGDDLLALLPLQGADPEQPGKTVTIFGFVEKLRRIFNGVFRAGEKTGVPTISMGISVQYYKSPLYEALERAQNLLYDAKSGIKNACYLDLQKHSGQSSQISDEGMDTVEENLFKRLDGIYSKLTTTDPEKTVLFLHGAGAQIERYEELFRGLLIKHPANWRVMLKNLFDNLYDNIDQSGFRPYLDELTELAKYIFTRQVISDHPMTESRARQTVEMLEDALRLLQFMLEKKGEE